MLKMKPTLLSTAAAIMLLGPASLNAESMYDKFMKMEAKMKQLESEIKELKEQNEKLAEQSAQTEDEEEESEESAQAKTAALDSQEEPDQEASDQEDDDEGDDDEEESVEEQLADLQESVTELNKATATNHLKFNVDYRFTVDNLQYKMADGNTTGNDAIMTNRLWINMNWAATKNLSFRAQLAYYKTFGQRITGAVSPINYESFDWIVSENPYDDTLRLRFGYFLYKNDSIFGANIPWTFSVGRRPSTNGHLINLRDDDQPSSPMGHTINVEFDGMSAKFGLEELTGVSGMYIKLCAGRGLTVAQQKFTPTPYAGDDFSNKNIDLAGFIFVPYNDGQYSVNTQYYYASNLIDNINPLNPSLGFETVGGMHSFTANFMANGIGDGISDFLDDTIFFVSGAVNITDPKDDKRMLYFPVENGVPTPTGESKTGYSAWVGLQFPSLLTEDGRWGLEYNWGSEYWKSITYAEDTLIGSKVAARGNAYEAYFTEYLIDDILSMQIRYTYIDYKYKGSNGFFGATSGASAKIEDITNPIIRSRTVDTAQDIRFYLRYRY